MNSSKYRKARRRVKRKKIFYFHFAIYLTIGAFLFAMNILTDPWDIWFPIPLTAWFLPLSLHYLHTFGVPFLKLDKAWEEKELAKELGQLPSPPPFDQEEELELKDFRHLRDEWKDQDFV